ncbi:uncharacterized protein FIBRA_07465 [Fibroporia radiculosa]|uniref:G-protein coupled receptors family 1 profile domain-containing protein n=1 Tax=Fibroporia radiculosa TaxID=599839 RepID=J4GV12_9APHY|nr:uncharacterized protein FIBRA_07465 [Fibroporia radiculosa]CCM05255.1 predicted protein [Fibroporia radiculosa]
MSNSSWAPNETASVIFAEETWLQGALLSNIAYGMQLTLFVMCFVTLVRKMDRHNFRRQLFLLSFICVIFTIGTLFMGSQAKFTQQAFIEYRNYPGGPSVYEEAEFANPVDEIANVCFVVGNWLLDAFLVWRFMVIFRDFGQGWLAALTFFPVLMLLASVALGLALLIDMTGSSPFAFVNITLAYYVMSLSLNVIVTLLIVGRLLIYRRRMARVFGTKESSDYLNISAILIESASLYSIFAVLFIVPFGLGNSLANVFLDSVSQVQIVSSLLIIYRVATGKAWSQSSATELTTNPSTTAIQLKHMGSMRFATVTNASTAVDSVMTKNTGGISITRDVIREKDSVV